MRIRTIKPEFWTNPELAKLDPFTRLLAIGLLNYADDEGYFCADPELMRSAIFPYEQKSVRIHGALTELSQIKFVTLHDGINGRLYAKITTFENHQRINRPTESKLKTWINFSEQSVSPHAHLTAGTGNREQGKEQGTGKGAAAPGAAKSLSPQKTDLMRRTECLFRRREATPWSKAELEAWKRAQLGVETTSDDEWRALERFYSLTQQPPPAVQFYRRQNLDTLLNHWASEIDKAKTYFATPGRQADPDEARRRLEKQIAEREEYERRHPGLYIPPQSKIAS